MSTCWLCRHVRSAAVREFMAGPDVRARLPISDAWLAVRFNSIDQRRPTEATSRPREWNKEGGKTWRVGKNKTENKLDIGMHSPGHDTGVLNGKTSLHNGRRIKPY